MQGNNYTRSIDTMILNLARYGVKIEDIKHEPESLFKSVVRFFVTVPQSSDLTLEDGTEASGENLAKYIKAVYSMHRDELLKIYGLDSKMIQEVEEEVKVKYKLRDERWTRSKEEENTLTMMLAIANKHKQETNNGGEET